MLVRCGEKGVYWKKKEAEGREEKTVGERKGSWDLSNLMKEAQLEQKKTDRSNGGEMKDLRKGRSKNDCSKTSGAACCEQKLWISLRVRFTGLLISEQGKFYQRLMTTVKVHPQTAPQLKHTTSDGEKRGAMALFSSSCIRYFTVDTDFLLCSPRLSSVTPV